MRTVSQNAKDTSGKILQAAVKLFAQYGYDGVSIKTISREAGANSALISYYFGGKPQLYEAVLSRQADKLLSLVEQLKAEGQLPLAAILAFMDAVTDAFLEKPENVYVIYREFLTPTKCGSDVIGGQMLSFYDRLTEAFEYAKQQQSVKPETNSRHAAFVLISVFAFYLMTYSYEALSESKRLPGDDDFIRLRAVYLDYLMTISTGKEPLQ